MTRLRHWLLVAASIYLIVLSALVLLRVVQIPTGIDTTGNLWEIVTAIGTLGATLTAVGLAWQALRQDRGSVARLVSAWVTEEYLTATGAPSYTRVVKVHVANESNEPVFDSHISITIGRKRTPLGPLGIPPMAVVAQRREREFDITLALQAHEATSDPRVEFWFSDSRGRRWLRDGDGRLEDVTGRSAEWVAVPQDEDQLGRQDANNPMFVSMLFLNILRAEDGIDKDALSKVLAPEAAVGWNKTDFDQLRTQYETFQPTSMVDYPAPYVARVKLSGNPDLEGKTVSGERMELEIRPMTLTYAPDRGWRVWGIGSSVLPNEILFPPGTF